MKIHRLLLLLFLINFSGYSQVKYEVSFENPEDHFATVNLRLENLKTGENTLVLPVWTPGYYKILDNPAHIVDFTVTAQDGEEIDWFKTSKNKWSFKNAAAQNVSVSYGVYANRKSVAESNISAEKGFLAATDIFMYPEGSINSPVEVNFKVPAQWQYVSTGLAAIEEDSFYAKNFDMLYDSPFYLGNQKIIRFQELGKDFSLAIATPAGLDEEKIVDDLKKIIKTTTNLMGHIPYENYAFIMMEKGGGGLEHWNSQAVFTRGSFDFESSKAYKDFMNFITHEYFHLYNVKAVRPIELGPFNYSKENYTTMLWVAEGFTVYYEYLIMQRAGLLDQQDVLDFLSSHICSIENSEGKKHMSLERSSYDIWNYFLNRDEITGTTTISYYEKGPIIGFLLDLAIRQESQNRRSLDDVMRYLYDHFYAEEGRGYTEEEFWQVSEKMAGNSLEEIRSYVETTNEPNYTKYLKYAALGLNLEPVSENDGSGGKKFQLIKLEPANELQIKIRNSIIGQ